jgi:hypothetical protein
MEQALAHKQVRESEPDRIKREAEEAEAARWRDVPAWKKNVLMAKEDKEKEKLMPAAEEHEWWSKRERDLADLPPYKREVIIQKEKRDGYAVSRQRYEEQHGKVAQNTGKKEGPAAPAVPANAVVLPPPPPVAIPRQNSARPGAPQAAATNMGARPGQRPGASLPPPPPVTTGFRPGGPPSSSGGVMLPPPPPIK